MKFNSKLIIACIIFFLISGTSSSAKLLEDSRTLDTEKWEVSIQNIYKENNNTPYQSFDVAVKNKGKDAKMVRVEVYKKEENNNRAYSLMTLGTQDTRDLVMKNEAYMLKNLSISEKANEVIVEVLWLEEDRPVKESFIFN